MSKQLLKMNNVCFRLYVGRSDWTMLFDTPEMRETIVKVHKAEDGLKENMDRLGEYLFELSTD